MSQNFKQISLIFVLNLFYGAGHDKTNGLIYILLWTDIVTHPFDHIRMEQYAFIDKNCFYRNCFLTADSSFFKNVTDFDAILFDAMDLYRNIDIGLPSRRFKGQKYIFISTESPVNKPLPPLLDGIFNWTWTYKLDSDISFSYISIRNKHGDVIGPKQDMHWMDINKMQPITKYVKKKLRRKSKAATWFVSNCYAYDKRNLFASKLKEELMSFGHQLDTYGFCGELDCPRDSKVCYSRIEIDYYFYLAFENSFSEDYVSEKLLNALQHYAVPVVYGGANYTRYMPDGIYLDARVLGPSKLAKMMNEIILNKQKYYDFFKWHRYYSFHDPKENSESDPFCLLCESLNDKTRRKQMTVLEDFADWWNRPTRFPELLED